MKKYRIVNFKKRANKKWLEGIEYARRKPSRGIEISKWHGHDSSFWIKIFGWKNQIILDSGVIEQLYKEIQRLKKTGLKNDILDKLFVINNPKEIY